MTCVEYNDTTIELRDAWLLERQNWNQNEYRRQIFLDLNLFSLELPFALLKRSDVYRILTLVYRRGVVATPLRIIFRSAKTLKFTIKWVQLIVGSSFPVMLAQFFLLPYPGVGVG